MDAVRVYALLQEACLALEAANEHDVSAFVGQSMAMVADRYGVGQDHLSDPDTD